MLNNSTISALSRSLDGSALRQELLAHNIANADTPGYQRHDLDFAAFLKASEGNMATTRTHPRHLTPNGVSGMPRGVPTRDGAIRADGNTVVIETEMARLSQNAMFFQSLSNQLNKEFGRLRAAISGRG